MIFLWKWLYMRKCRVCHILVELYFSFCCNLLLRESGARWRAVISVQLKVTLTSAFIVVCVFWNVLPCSHIIFQDSSDSIKKNLYGLLIQFLFICREMKINCYCDFIYNAHCKMVLWADRCKTEKWLEKLHPACVWVYRHWVTSLNVLTPIVRGERMVLSLGLVFCVLERQIFSLTRKQPAASYSIFSHLSVSASAEVVVDILHGLTGKEL